MNKKEYQQFCKTGSTQPLVATKANTRSQIVSERLVHYPKNTMIGYGKKNHAIRVIRNGRTVASRELHTLALDLINGRENTESFRKEMKFQQAMKKF